MNCNDCKYHGSPFKWFDDKKLFYCLEPEVLENVGYVYKRYNPDDEPACGRYKPNLSQIRKLKLDKIKRYDESRRLHSV